MKKGPPANKRRAETPRLRFRAVFERDGRWIIGSSTDVPGAFSQERTLAAARRALADVVRDFAEHDPRLAKRLRSTTDYVAEEMLTVRAP